jgi:hypothetical protein
MARPVLRSVLTQSRTGFFTEFNFRELKYKMQDYEKTSSGWIIYLSLKKTFSKKSSLRSLQGYDWNKPFSLMT